MSLGLIASLIGGYFLILILVSLITDRNSDEKSFYLGNRKAHWFMISFGMIGASLSGVTFISVPGVVGNIGHINGQFSYLQVVLGYFLGYFVIASVLLPIYYRLNLTSIYGYLESRFGFWSYKTGSAFFLLSRLVGSSIRLFLTAGVLDHFLFKPLGVPFWVTVAATILLIYVYTFRGGIKTIIYTDTLQTLMMLGALGFTIYYLLQGLNFSVQDFFTEMEARNLNQIFFWDDSPRNFWKQFSSGFLIALVMTGLDQDMMQKNLGCKNLHEAKKNIYTLSFMMVIVNTLFVLFGALLYVYSYQKGFAIPAKTDLLYPTLAIEHLGGIVGVLFVLGLIAAAYSSADSTLTSLTTAFVVDFLNFEKKGGSIRTRRWVHIGFAFLTFLLIVIFQLMADDSVITSIFKAAGYTYGPLLGLFAYGILTKKPVWDQAVPFICVASMFISFYINKMAPIWWDGYTIGFEILFYNGLLTFILLFLSTLIQNRKQISTVN